MLVKRHMKETSKKHYRFAALSDIHIDLENGGKNTYFIYAEENFRRALQVIRDSDCEFVISAGDQVTNATGAKEEWRRYRRIIDKSGYAGYLFETLGNHELRYALYGGCSLQDCRDEFIRYTSLAQKPVDREEGRTYYEYLHPLFGDCFLFMANENGMNTNEIDNFSDEQTDWAERLIERRIEEGRRVFLIQHAPLCGFGAGDDRDDPACEGAIRLRDKDGRPFINNQRFSELIKKHKDMIWLSGHTHVCFEDGVNYSDENGSACHMLHIPALAGTTRLSYDNEGRRTLDRTFRPYEAQGYIVDVYEDEVIFSGVNFYDDLLIPLVSYRIIRQ